MTEKAQDSILKRSEIVEAKIQGKLDNLYWSNEELSVVTSFLRGDSVVISSPDERRVLWEKVAISTDIEPENYSHLAQELHAATNEIVPINNVHTDEPDTGSSYDFRTNKRSDTVQKIALDALRRFGIWGPNESRRIVTHAGHRSEGKSTYWQDEHFNKRVSDEKGYLPPEDGGPQLASVILSPQHEASKNRSDRRERKSLAHEINHLLRAQSNKSFWDGFETEASDIGLKKPAKERVFLGGFLVGSNYQGSESIGDFFGIIVENIESGGKGTIKEVLPYVEQKLAKRTKKFTERYDQYRLEIESYYQGEQDEQPTGIKGLRYLTANLALVHHLEQLKESGFGNLPAEKLIALGSYGYVSFEKLPSLISLGLVTQEKVNKMYSVITSLRKWLTSTNKKGYVFEDKTT